MGSMKVFMKVEGIAGSSMEKGRKDWSDVRGFNHALQYPFDMRDNRGRGEPEHGACTVLKEIDKASPKLYEALAKKKKVDSLLLEFERDKPGECASPRADEHGQGRELASAHGRDRVCVSQDHVDLGLGWCDRDHIRLRRPEGVVAATAATT
jgi:hypothetical protein